MAGNRDMPFRVSERNLGPSSAESSTLALGSDPEHSSVLGPVPSPLPQGPSPCKDKCPNWQRGYCWWWFPHALLSLQPPKP